MNKEDKEIKEGVIYEKNAKTENVGEASFEKAKKSKKSLILIIVGIIVVSLILFARTDEGKNILTDLGIGQSSISKKIKYVNPINKYSFEYKPDENSRLVSAGNIPAELELEGIKSMQDLNLTDGDALLVRSDMISKNNIIYTVREMSETKEYSTFDEYLEVFRVNLSNTVKTSGTEYTEKESFVGKDKLSATEFSFELEVLTNNENTEKVFWVFSDTLFEVDDTVYSISFGYPKNIENAQFYIDSYRNIIDSFDYDEEIDEKVDSIPDDSEDMEAETIPEEDKIEVVE